MTKLNMAVVLVVGLIFILDLSMGTKIGSIRVEVPERAEELSVDSLYCFSEVASSNTNYTLKWYKNDKEFYRYTSKNKNNPIELFDVVGVRVNKAFSDESKVYLEDITYQSPGMYKCEITTEGPNSEKQFGEKEMGIRFYSGQSERYSCDTKPFNDRKSLKITCHFIVNGTNIFGKPWNFNWYKNDQLFYSYTPEKIDTPHVSGVYLDAQQTYKNTIVLHHMSSKSMGKYVMEITWEPTDSSEKPLKYSRHIDLDYLH